MFTVNWRTNWRVAHDNDATGPQTYHAPAPPPAYLMSAPIPPGVGERSQASRFSSHPRPLSIRPIRQLRPIHPPPGAAKRKRSKPVPRHPRSLPSAAGSVKSTLASSLSTAAHHGTPLCSRAGRFHLSHSSHASASRREARRMPLRRTQKLLAIPAHAVLTSPSAWRRFVQATYAEETGTI